VFDKCIDGSYCSEQARTPVGANNTQIYHRTVTTLTGQGPAYTGSKTEVYIITKNAAGIDEWKVAATTIDGGKTYNFTDVAGTDFRKSMGAGGNMNKNVQAQVQKTLTKGGETQGLVPLPNKSGSLEKIKPEQQKSLQIVSPTVGVGAASTASTTISKEELEKSIKSIARTKYDQLIKYPLTLNENFQDYIKFQMIEYKPRGLGSADNIGVIPARERIDTSIKRQVSKEGEKQKREILGSVVLPIPGNISDGNTVSWGDARMDPIVNALTEAAVGGIREGFKGLEESARKAGESATKNTSSIKGIVLGKFTELATGINPLTRLYGVVANPNLELLFNGPDLRNFTFTFRLSPRDKNEAIAVRKIIRFFKQGMSVKRTEGELFLGSPHTFQLSYWNTTTREHPYLNKFKECALKSFSVNYAPDGTYMTYNDRNEPSMTAYEITMQFTELEPVFDDDYGNNENEPAKDFIGY